MKKIFILFAAVMCAVSSFKGAYSEFSANVGSNFEFQGDADYKKDSVYFKTDFFSGNYLIYRGARTEASGSAPVSFRNRCRTLSSSSTVPAWTLACFLP